MNQLSGQVTDDEIRKVNDEANVNNERLEEVARDYSKNIGLMK